MMKAAFILSFVFIFGCKKDEPKHHDPVAVSYSSADAGPVSDARLYALPPRGNAQISCLRDHAEVKGAPIKFYCWNIDGQWACDIYGCAWLKALPEGHPFRKPLELEMNSMPIPVPGAIDGGALP